MLAPKHNDIVTDASAHMRLHFECNGGRFPNEALSNMSILNGLELHERDARANTVVPAGKLRTRPDHI